MLKIGNAISIMGIEPMSLAFCVLTITSPRLTDAAILPVPVYVAPCLRGQCEIPHWFPWTCKSFNAYNYIQAMTLHRDNLHRILVTVSV